jgi:hypothetical protein
MRIRANEKSVKGSAVVVVTMLLMLMMVAGVVFMKRAGGYLILSGVKSDALSAQYQMEAAYETAKSKLSRAMVYDATTSKGVILNGRLRFADSTAPSQETFNNLSNAYAANQLGFLKLLIEQQAYSGTGVRNTAHEFVSFATAFPTSWTDPNLNDNQYFEIKYTFTPIDMISQVSPQQLTFEYEYRLQVRAYGQKNYQTVGSEDAGILSINVTGAPFSQYAAFMNSMLNQNGSTLVFAGGNTSSQIQEVYGGRVHVNGTPNFYGHPTFSDMFTSATASTSWVYYNVTGYTSCPTMCPNFNGGSQGGVSAISMPTQIFNTLRLAAGDTSPTAATNNTAVTNSDINGFLAYHANGSVTAGSAALADGIYVPIDNPSSKNPTGGIYIQGDARIQMNVVTGSSDFSAAQWSQMQASHQSCKFQKFAISSLTAGVHSRDIYVGDDPCNVTYVYDATDTSQAPAVLNARINGNLHVNGKIDQLGGASRTRPAVARDFGFTVSALKDVRIINDLQYEDATYVTVAADGTMGTTAVANPTGAVGGSGVQPTADHLAAQIPADSQTILGIISTQRNVVIHSSAPANINIHGAIFAGNSAAYNAATGVGCGAAGVSTQGCGFGYEGWNTNTGMGSIKFLGSMSEYKDQTTGVLSSPPKGYGSLYFYDARLRNTITPPAFPVTNTPNAVATVKPFRTWRISQQ